MTNPVTQVARQAKRTLVIIIRWSYVAKAFLYGAAGVLAIRSSIGLGGDQPDRKKVLEGLFLQPFGQVLVGLIILTLAGHTLWRIFEIFKDPYQKGAGAYGLLYRFTYFLSGVSYAGLAFTGAKMLLGKEEKSGDGKQLWAAKALYFEGGEWLIALIGGILILWATVQAYKGISGRIAKSLEADHLGRFWHGLFYLMGLIGFLTLAAIEGGIGFYFLKAAFTQNPRWVKSLDDLLALILSLPHGLTWLWIVAAGMITLSIFMLVMARYYPVKLDPEDGR